MNFIVPGSQSCIGPCCSERDIVVSISGISLIDGPDAEVSGCTVDVMNEMNAVLAADMTLSFQGVFGGECQWLLSYPPPSRVNSTDRLNVVVRPTYIRIFYAIPFTSSPQIQRDGTWNCRTWTPSGSWTTGGGDGKNCFQYSGYGSATETISIA